MSDIRSIMTRCAVIPVIVIDDLTQAAPLASALVAGGLTVLEVTLRTPVAPEAIRAMKEAAPDAIVGAGTVLNGDDLRRAADAGSDFLVSPGVNSDLLAAATDCSVPLLPGVATPTEAMALYQQGYAHLKFFPAEAAGGVPMLKSIGGPLPQLSFCPTGGVNPGNAQDYLALPNVLCVGGSWMVNSEDVRAGRWDLITEKAAAAAALKS